jgi:hypothetical protein
MSITQRVFLERASVPPAAAWARAIREHGFALELDPDFDVQAHAGFLPCRYREAATGFELSMDRVADAGLDGDARAAAGKRDAVVSFETHGDARALVASWVASSVLAVISGGVFWSDESGEASDPRRQDLIAGAREFERDTLAAEEKRRETEARAEALRNLQPRTVDGPVPAKVTFRGTGLLMLQTLEANPRRFTLRFDTSAFPASPLVDLASFWEHPSTGLVVRAVRADGVEQRFSPSGAATGGAPDAVALVRLLADVNRSEAAVRALVTLGAAAVPALVAVLRDETAALQLRTVAAVTLGTIGAAAAPALETLDALAGHAALGPGVRRARQRIAPFSR